MNKPTEATNSLPQEPIDKLDQEIRGLWHKDSTERVNPIVAKNMFEKLKEQIDLINNKPDNKKYLEEFSQWKEKSEKKSRNINKYILESIHRINIKTTTGKSKFKEYKEREGLDINNATIDHKGVYKIIELLETNWILGTTEKIYLEWQKKWETWVTINEEMYTKENAVSVKNFQALNIRKDESPFENAIININSNLEHHEWPTSSTRMVYEIVKKMDLITKLPEDDQKTLERFVYFVDFAYRLKQRIYGMDAMYICGTLFGNYKRLTLKDIWEYLKNNPTKTWFEPLTEDEAEKLKILKPKGTIKGNIYESDTMANIVRQKQEDLTKALNKLIEIEDERTLIYKSAWYKEQEFFFDIGTNTQLLEEIAPMWEYAFCKLHPSNEIYIRSYYDLPPNFWWFVTENGNTIHGKLTEKNIENFLSVFEWDDTIKDKIRSQFQKNMEKTKTPEKQEIKVGEKYEGTVDNVQDFGVFIKIKKWNYLQSWLLHKSEMNNKKLNKWDKVDVVVNKITWEGKVNFRLAPKLTVDTIQEGDVFDGTISNISKGNLVFVRIDNTNISWLLKTRIDRENIKEILEVSTPVKVKVIKKSEKWLIFEITM